MIYDVIVVGAGPAGSTTARECAARGLSVLLLDKAEFPRDKPCGGAVTVRAAELLPFDIAPVVESVISRVRVTERQSRGFTRSSSHELVYLTQRSRLDAFLVECAINDGAIFRQREPIREVERHQTHVVVRTTDDTFEGRTLVAADGANGMTARLAGLEVRHLHGIAMEGNIMPLGGVPEEWKDTIGLDFGDVPGGYGWIFPKGEHLNIGVGGWRYIGPTLRDKLMQLIRFYGFDPTDLRGLRAHLVPLRRQGSPLIDDNIVLVGDAAGLINPLTGEGMYAAFLSGRTAAEQLASYLGEQVPDLDVYRREMERMLLPELRVSRQFHDVFHLWPGLFIGFERRTSIPWEALVRLFRGDRTYLAAVRKLGPVWTALEFVSDLIRVSPPLRRLSGLRDPAPPERFFRRGAQHPSTSL